MKLISLNLQNGTVYEPMMGFIKKHSSDVDIFCLQEVFNNEIKADPLLGEKVRLGLFSELQDLLSDFSGYHFPTYEGNLGGLAIFIKKSFVVNKVDNLIIFSETNTRIDEASEDFFAMGRNLQVLEFNNLGKVYTILNFHGMWIEKGKIDTEKRLEQSEKVKKVFEESIGVRILCGDFNITPDTKSLTILTKGNKDLIKEYGITSTRSLLKNRHEVVDYVIASPEVEVLKFEVLKDEVSDHLPLMLEFK